MKPPVKYCAVYTRKSTEEGLEQEFNTLDAQREACLAYISSQKAEGWVALQKHYDDGGFTGGNIKRPALQELLSDIREGKVHTVVVYKIDRLTRSLMDFSKLVEVFDAHGVTFVSITQSFNTTTSMGRLTLNVLLSFAQFEREVIGERVRDKIAASKKKGMWMGGHDPLGYRRIDKLLKPEDAERNTVRAIFERYLTLGSLTALTLDLERRGITSRRWTSSRGQSHGGRPYSRGALHCLLTNPVYIGKIKHKNNVFEGQHEAIIPLDLWESVQHLLQAQAGIERGRKTAPDDNLLHGLLQEPTGTLFRATFTTKGTEKRRYRYYITKQQRLPALQTEQMVTTAILQPLADPLKTAELLGLDVFDHHATLETIAQNYLRLTAADLLPQVLYKVVVEARQMVLHINPTALAHVLGEKLMVQFPRDDLITHTPLLTVPMHSRRGKRGSLLIAPPATAEKDIFDLPSADLKKLVQGFIWRDEHFAGKSLKEIAQREKVSDSYVGKAVFMSFRD